MVSRVSASHVIDGGFAPRLGHTKNCHKMVHTASLLATQTLGYEFGSSTKMCKRPGSVWNCLQGHPLFRSPGINQKARVLYPNPGFLSSATWSSTLKNHSKQSYYFTMKKH